MKDEYIIVNKTAIQKRIEELEGYKDEPEITELKIYKEILSQSTPLIPEIEKSWKAGWSHCVYLSEHLEKEKREEYILNLKLDL